MRPKVSIVIPAYNEEASIAALLKVILAVDLKSIGFDREIIVVDDGSRDETFSIGAKSPRPAFRDVSGCGIRPGQTLAKRKIC